MAEDLDSIVPAVRVEPASTLPPAAASQTQPAGVFQKRFAVAYLTLAVLAGLAIGFSVLLFDRPATREAIWSAWQPKGSQATFDDQIARYVSGRYRLPSGNPLAAIVPGSPTFTFSGQELAITDVVIQDDPEGDRDGIRVVDVDRSWMYQLCGLGTRCSIEEGTPSEERLRILRREALELALYTFKYGDDIDTVLALLPPNIGDPDNPEDDSAAALFFEKSTMRAELERPLRQTLVSASPPQGIVLDPRESLMIERLTAERLFLYRVQPLQAGSALMYLLRPSSVQ